LLYDACGGCVTPVKASLVHDRHLYIALPAMVWHNS